MDVFLDRNPSHQLKMQRLVAAKMEQKAFKINFFFFPPYSPWLNPVEFLIHLIRQKELHHQCPERNLNQIEQICIDKLHDKQYFQKDNLLNILEHIEQIILEKYRKTMVERE